MAHSEEEVQAILAESMPGWQIVNQEEDAYETYRKSIIAPDASQMQRNSVIDNDEPQIVIVTQETPQGLDMRTVTLQHGRISQIQTHPYAFRDAPNDFIEYQNELDEAENEEVREEGVPVDERPVSEIEHPTDDVVHEESDEEHPEDPDVVHPGEEKVDHEKPVAKKKTRKVREPSADDERLSNTKTPKAKGTQRGVHRKKGKEDALTASEMVPEAASPAVEPVEKTIPEARV